MEPKDLLTEMDNPIAFLTQTGDTMHMNQALNQPIKA